MKMNNTIPLLSLNYLVLSSSFIIHSYMVYCYYIHGDSVTDFIYMYYLCITRHVHVKIYLASYLTEK